MAFRGLKETTKDIDLIVSSGDDLRQLLAVVMLTHSLFEPLKHSKQNREVVVFFER